MRVVSLVPSLTDVVAALGRADWLVGVTDFCPSDAPEDAVRLRGTKNAHIDRALQLDPDVVLANPEENRGAHLDRLRDAGTRVIAPFPKTVVEVDDLLAELGDELDAAAAADTLRADLAAARDEAAATRPVTPLSTLTLIWRKPWMGVGPDTYVDDLLAACGLTNTLVGFGERYPRLEEGLLLAPQVVLLPSEPYPFGEDDAPAAREAFGAERAAVELVDGQALTWHGPRTAAALRTFSALARELTGRTG